VFVHHTLDPRTRTIGPAAALRFASRERAEAKPTGEHRNGPPPILGLQGGLRLQRFPPSHNR